MGEFVADPDIWDSTTGDWEDLYGKKDPDEFVWEDELTIEQEVAKSIERDEERKREADRQRKAADDAVETAKANKTAAEASGLKGKLLRDAIAAAGRLLKEAQDKRCKLNPDQQKPERNLISENLAEAIGEARSIVESDERAVVSPEQANASLIKDIGEVGQRLSSASSDSAVQAIIFPADLIKNPKFSFEMHQQDLFLKQPVYHCSTAALDSI